MLHSMPELKTFRDVMELWPTVGQFAEEIGVPAPTANKWRQRNRVPPGFWSAILGTRKARKAKVTADLLVTLAARSQNGGSDQ